MTLRGVAAFGFVVMIVLAVGSVVLVASPSGLNRTLSTAIMLGMLIAVWTAIMAGVAFVLESREPRRR